MTERPLPLPSPFPAAPPAPEDESPAISPAELYRLLEAAREEERERMARDIHDALGSQLVAVKMEASLLAAELAGGAPRLQRRLEAVTDLLEEALDATSRFSRELRPGILRDFGLAAAIECQAEDFARRTGLACRLPCIHQDVELSDERALAVFRVFQEALTNVCKHAQATAVEVRLVRLDEELLLEILDDGCGMSAADLEKHRSSGLRGMRARLAGLGGRIELQGRRGCGTRLRVILPLEPASADARRAVGAATS